ncbi:MAG: hypothetical protein EA377_09800 [Phycisphaerales bacterium]|nr:MAG: hypothetical protein EA377_09800 [Phycisphaerales bacterium]
MLQRMLERPIRRPRATTLALLMVALIAIIAVPLWAQVGGGTGGEGAPSPQLRRAPSPLIGYGLMALMFAAVITVSLIPSKRGHQD